MVYSVKTGAILDLEALKFPDGALPDIDAGGRALFLLNGDGRIIPANDEAMDMRGFSDRLLLKFAEREIFNLPLIQEQRDFIKYKGLPQAILSIRGESVAFRTYVSPTERDPARRLVVMAAQSDLPVIMSDMSDFVTLQHKAAVEVTKRMLEVLAVQDALRKELEEMALQDPLTGLPNRRAADYLYELLMGAAKRRAHDPEKNKDRENKLVAVIMLDIDFFKSVNDTHGHRIGDEVLKHLAGILKSTKRASDSACRIGGEEIVLIGYTNGEEGAVELAERVRKVVETTPYEYTKDGEKVTLKITASFGVALVDPLQEMTLEEAKDIADQGLYVGKRTGRNKVVFAHRSETGEVVVAQRSETGEMVFSQYQGANIPAAGRPAPHDEPRF